MVTSANGLGNLNGSSLSLSSWSTGMASASALGELGLLCRSINLRSSELLELLELLDSESEDSSSCPSETLIIEDFCFFKGGSGIGKV